MWMSTPCHFECWRLVWINDSRPKPFVYESVFGSCSHYDRSKRKPAQKGEIGPSAWRRWILKVTISCKLARLISYNGIDRFVAIYTNTRSKIRTFGRTWPRPFVVSTRLIEQLSMNDSNSSRNNKDESKMDSGLPFSSYTYLSFLTVNVLHMPYLGMIDRLLEQISGRRRWDEGSEWS